MIKVVVQIIRIYQIISFYTIKRFGIKLCRFEPTCSNYTILAVKKYGLINGFRKTVIRIIKCNPFNSSSYIDYP